MSEIQTSFRFSSHLFYLKVITDHLKSYENDSEFHKIPNLGKHYSLKWEHNDLLDQKEQSSHSGSDKKKGLSASNNASGSSGAQSSNKSKKGSKN